MTLMTIDVSPLKRAIVWFADCRPDAPWWMRLLKPGYRHCGVLIEDVRFDIGSGVEVWAGINPRICGTEVDVWLIPSIDLLFSWFKHPRHGAVTSMIVTRVAPAVPERPYPWFPCTCVEQVKRLLGLRGWFIWTPWQLYRRISDED